MDYQNGNTVNGGGAADVYDGNGAALYPVELPPAKVSLKDIAREARELVAVLAELRAVALSLTSHADWEFFGKDEKPYLKDTGCQAVALAMGIYLRNLREQVSYHEDAAGQYYSVTYFADGYLPTGKGSSFMGSCDSRDQFFSSAGHGEVKEQSEISLTDIKAKAFTNLHGKAVRGLLALNSLSKEEVTAALLSGPGGSAKVDALSNKASVPFKTASDLEEEDRAIIEKIKKGKKLSKSEMLRNIQRMVNNMGRDKAQREAILLELTSFQGDKRFIRGVKTVDEMKGFSDGSVFMNHKRVAEAYEDYKREAGVTE